MDSAARDVLQRFGLGSAALEPLGNRGGFSGARLWRCRSSEGNFCLRAWPEGTAAARLAVIHRWMRTAREQYHLEFVPAVRKVHRDVTLIEHEGRLWDLTSWMPGLADFREHPSRERLEQACIALAFLHVAWGGLTAERGPCPAIERRVHALDEWLHLVSSGWQPPPSNELANRAWQILALRGPGVAAWLALWRLAELTLRPCLCDVWDDHLLFEGEQLTGLIDYGEAKIDNPAVDLARMLGSLIEDDEEAWKAGLAAYRRVRQLSETEEALARILDRTGTILGAANWLRWLYHEGRRFEDPAAAERRLAVLVARMERW